MKSKIEKCLIIILNWNGIDDTIDCLNSIFRVYKSINILVVDNGSKINEAKKIRDLYGGKVNTLRLSSNRGYCGGNNASLNWAKSRGYEYLVILNNDTIILDRVFEKLLIRIDDKVSIVGATIVDYYNRHKIQNRGFKYNSFVGTSFAIDQKNFIDGNLNDVMGACVSGACFAINIKALNGEMLFEESFFCYFEEIELCLRLKKSGNISRIAGDALIYHKGEASSSKITGFTEYQMARNRLWLIKKHLKPIAALPALVINILLYIPYRIFALVFSGNSKNIKYFVSGSLAGFIGKTVR